MLHVARGEVIRILLVAGIVAALLPASPALAQDEPFDDERIVISGPVVVQEGETVEDVVVFHGSATIHGRVQGDLVVFDGPVDVSGVVNGDLVAFRGPVNLADTAEITGDAMVGGNLTRAPGAEIAGETTQGEFFRFPAELEFFGRLAAWLAFTVSMLAVGLLMLLLGPRATEALAATGLSRTAPALGWGLVAFFAIPIMTLVFFFTIIGIPLAVMLLFGMLFFFPVGYATTALVAGRKIVPGPGKRVVSFLAGLAVLRLVAVIPILGGLTWFLATAFGLGVIAMTIGQARNAPVETAPAVTTPAPAS